MRYSPGRWMRALVLVVVLGLVASGIAYAAIPKSASTQHAVAGSSFNYTIVHHTTQNNGQITIFRAIRSLSVTCPSGTVVLGGGAKFGTLSRPDGLLGYQVMDSYPNGKTGWTAVFYQSLKSSKYRAEVYAACAKLT